MFLPCVNSGIEATGYGGKKNPIQHSLLRPPPGCLSPPWLLYLGNHQNASFRTRSIAFSIAVSWFVLDLLDLLQSSLLFLLLLPSMTEASMVVRQEEGHPCTSPAGCAWPRHVL